MKEVIENMKTVLLDGMPNLFHGIPLSQLPESHPEVLTQNVLVDASKKYIANPIDIARAMFADAQIVVTESGIMITDSCCDDSRWRSCGTWMALAGVSN